MTHRIKALIYFLVVCIVVIAIGCKAPATPAANNDKQTITNLLESFNKAAADADYTKYFNFFAEDAVFIGTDATERWDKKAFMVWAKPFFDKKTTWKFTALERNIFIDSVKQIAWFDELLNTQMKICRGSGVLTKQNNQWLLQQYVLSTTVPNDKLDSVILMKKNIEDSLIKTFAK